MEKQRIINTYVTNDYIGKSFESQTKDWIKEYYSNQLLSIEPQYEIIIQSDDMLKVCTKNADDLIKQYTHFNSRYVFDFRVMLKSGKQIFIEAKTRDGSCDGKKDSKQGLNKDVATDNAIEKGRLLQLFCFINGITDYEYIVVSNAFPKPTNNNYLKMFLAINIDKVISEVVILDRPVIEHNLDLMFSENG